MVGWNFLDCWLVINGVRIQLGIPQAWQERFHALIRVLFVADL
jgi:hypothetical protein